VIVPWWAVRRWADLFPPERGGAAHVCLHPSGEVVPVEPVKVGAEIASWEPVA
jgi:hypothetical protein